MGRRARFGTLAVAVPAVLAATLAGSPAAGAAALSQLPGTAACVAMKVNGCARGRALSEPEGPVTISPDGHSAYLVADSRPEGVEADALDVFDRDPATGALTQKAGAEGCFAASGKDGCAKEAVLTGAREAVVSPDGRDVYVSTPAGVAIYARDTTTGALTPLGLGGVVECAGAKRVQAPCPTGLGLERPEGLVFSPDGAELYVTNGSRPTVAVLRRDPLTGKLSHPAGAAGCTVATAHGRRCAKLGKRAGSTYDIVASSDGRSIYALEVDEEGVASIELFARQPNGTLRRTGGRTGCLHKTGPAGCKGGRGLRLIEGLALSPGGHSLYVTSLYESYAGSVSIFDRGPTGALTQPPGKEACLSANGGECAVDMALSEAGWIAVSPDGTAVYVTSLWGLAVLGRSENGALTVPPRPRRVPLGLPPCLRPGTQLRSDQRCLRQP
jgi:DNA-binding beta-propeller fold protein YncE